MIQGFDAEQLDQSILTKRTMTQIAGDEGSAEWESSKKVSRGGAKAAWLAETLARVEKKRRALSSRDTKLGGGEKPGGKPGRPTQQSAARSRAGAKSARKRSSSAGSLVEGLQGAVPRTMPRAITPMLASLCDQPFDDPNWLFEIKWDGYRAVAFLDDGSVRLVSRNHNDLTAKFSELTGLSTPVTAKNAILDGEVVVLDAEGRPSLDRKSTRLNSSHSGESRMPSSA